MKGICIALLFGMAVFNAPGQNVPPLATSLGNYTESLQAPARVATDSEGRLYVTEPKAGQVVVFDAFGRHVATRGGFARPLGIAIDPQGNIYLAEEASGSVSVFNPQWSFLYKLGIGDGEFQLPNHIAVGPVSSGQRIYVSDSKANAIKVYAGAALTSQFGSAGQGDGQFDFPTGICVSTNGEAFVVDQNNDRCQVFNSGGTFLRAFNLGASNPSGRSQAAFLDKTGRLYVADTFQGMVKVFDAETGGILSTVGAFGAFPGQLASPAGLVLDPFNRLFITSANSRRVELYGLDAFLHLTTQPAEGLIAAGTNLILTTTSGGTGPFTYQWLKDGNAVSSATNATFTIASAEANNSGAYSVVLAGPSGTVTSGVTHVVVMVPPRIISQPQTQTVLRGATLTLEVLADGSALSYQWRLNGLNIEGANASTLSLQDLQTFQAGVYSVLVSNAVGTVLSAPASLTVMVPPSVMEIVSSTMATNQLFHLTLNTDPGFGYSLDVSSDLVQWQPLANLGPDGGLFEFIDFNSTNFWNRFYRLRWMP